MYRADPSSGYSTCASENRYKSIARALNRGAKLPGPLTISSYDNGRAVGLANNFGFRTTDYRRPSGASDLEPGEEIALVLSLEPDATLAPGSPATRAAPSAKTRPNNSLRPRRCCAARRGRPRIDPRRLIGWTSTPASCYGRAVPEHFRSFSRTVGLHGRDQGWLACGGDLGLGGHRTGRDVSPRARTVADGTW
jgi:hypothetical protein